MFRFFLITQLTLAFGGRALTPLERARMAECALFFRAAGYSMATESSDATIEKLLPQYKDRAALGELWKQVVPVTIYKIDAHAQLDLLQETYLKFSAALEKHPERFVSAAYTRNLVNRIYRTEVLNWMRSRRAVEGGSAQITASAMQYLLLYRDFGLTDGSEALSKHDSPEGDPYAPNPKQLDAYRAMLAGLENYKGLLTEEERQIVDLRFGSGLSQREIANRLGKHEGNISRALNRAFEKLAPYTYRE